MSLGPAGPFVAWPGWVQLKVAWLQSAVVSIWFGLVYCGADWLTALRVTRVRIHFDAELQIPLLPGFVVIYMSIYLIFLAAPFVLREREEFTRAVKAMMMTIGVAGVGFLLMPAKLAYGPPAELGLWAGLFRFADRLNLDYNLVPSLHVALSIVCLEMFAVRASMTGRMLLRLWGVLIAASTLFTHQHHLLDVVTGFLLALAVVKLFGTKSLSYSS